MRNFTVFVDADHLPSYAEGLHYVGLHTTAAPDYPEDAPVTGQEEGDAQATMRLWRWTWEPEGFLLYQLRYSSDGTPELSELSKANLQRLDPGTHKAAGNYTGDNIKNWLDERFGSIEDAKGYLGQFTIPEDFLKALRFRPWTADASVDPLEPTPPSILAFLANLTNVMAPVPQVGQLAHVVRFKQPDAVPKDEQVYLLFIPLFSLPWGGTTVSVPATAIKQAISRLGMNAITSEKRDEHFAQLTLRVRFSGTGQVLEEAATDVITAEAGQAEGAPEAEEPSSDQTFIMTIKLTAIAPRQSDATSDSLWATAPFLRLGASGPGLRETIAVGFELHEPLMRALEGFALYPDPISTFNLATSFLRDHVLPHPELRGAGSLEQLLNALDISDDSKQDINDIRQKIKHAYKAFHDSVTSDSSQWRKALEDASPDFNKALDKWRAQLDEAVSFVPSTAENKGGDPEGDRPPEYSLQYWDLTSLTWKSYGNNIALHQGSTSEAPVNAHLHNLEPRTEAGFGQVYLHAWYRHPEEDGILEKAVLRLEMLQERASNKGVASVNQRTLELDLTALARLGLRVGRHRVVRTCEEKGVEEEATAQGGGKSGQELRKNGGETVIARFFLASDAATLAPIYQLFSALSSSEVHGKLILGLLRSSLEGSGEEEKAKARRLLDDNERGLLEEIIPSTMTRPMIREANLRESIIKAMCPPSKKDVYSSTEDAIKNYWQWFKDGAGTLKAATIAQAIAKEMATHASCYLRTALPQGGAPISSSPLPLEIELEHPVKDREADRDVFSQRAGMAVLLRRKQSAWRCLNAARLELPSSNYVDSVVALPVAYQDGVAIASVRYEGVPVAVRSPVAPPDEDYTLEASGQELQTLTIAEYKFVENGGMGNDWAVPPLLVYGKAYEACGFFIHQSGALPKEIANPDAPWLIALPADSDLSGVRTSDRRYVRTTPVASPLIRMSKSSIDIVSEELSDIPLPEGVTPLARDLPRASLIAGGPARSFFRDGLMGTLNLANGPWSLTLEGIDLRGFEEFTGDAISPPTLHVVLAKSNPKPPLLSVAITFMAERVDIGLRGHKPLISLKRSTRLNSLELRFVPYGEDSLHPQEHLDVRLWAADAPPAFSETGCLNLAGIGTVNTLNAYLTLSVTGAARDKVASISFASPRIETFTESLEASEAYEPNVLLLAEGRMFPGSLFKSFTLCARPPVTEHASWDRHIAAKQLEAKELNTVDELQKVRGDVHGGWLIGLEVNEAVRSSGTAREVDVGLDDPSVRALLLEAVPLFAPDDALPIKTLVALDQPWETPIPNPKSVEDLLKAAKCKKNLCIDAAIATQNRQGFTLKPGEVWEVSIRPLIPKSEMHMFSNEVQQLLLPYKHDDGHEWCAGPARRLFVESATSDPADLPTYDEIRAVLNPQVSGRTIAVEFAPETLAEKFSEKGVETNWVWRGRRFAYLREATLVRQTWRWTGRPLDPYPFDVQESYGRVADFEKDLKVDALRTHKDSEVARIRQALDWEVKAFGDRDPADFATSTHVLRPVGRTALRQEQFQEDGRAQHWRFRLNVQSRYASILLSPRAGRVVGPPSKDEFGGNEPQLYDLWRRAFVPALPPLIVKPPSLHLLLPLTESSGEGRAKRPPPLLAIFDDAWFDTAGLAEELVAEVAKVAYESAETGSVVLQEFGPDPIRTGKFWGKLGESRIEVQQVGPIGYTFDEGASASRFAHSSFILNFDTEVPEIPIPDWSFIKLSFRRRLNPAGVEGDASDKSFLSEATPAQWVQLAADFSRFAVTEDTTSVIHTEELAVVKENEDWCFVRRSDGAKMTLRPYDPPEKGKLQTELCVVATERVLDAGRHETERFYGLFNIDERGYLVRQENDNGSTSPIPQSRLVCRVLELQTRKQGSISNFTNGKPETREASNDTPSASKPPSTWERLWPLLDEESTRQSKDDAEARITKVSRPIYERESH